MNTIKEYKAFDDFARFTIEGKEDYFSWIRNLTEIENKCSKNNHHKILIVKNIYGQLTMRETYKLYKEMSQSFYDRKIAIVDVLAIKNFVLNDFGESVFDSSGVSGKIFTTENEAKKWLLLSN